MKKLTLTSLAVVLGLVVYACGGGGSKAQNPNDMAKQFTNPTGTLTSKNAKDVATQAVSAKNSSGALSYASTLKKSETKIDTKYLSATNTVISQSDIERCVSSSGNSSTIDWECLAPALGEDGYSCTGSGTTKTTTNSGDNFYTIDYDGFSLNCSGSSDFAFSCDGQASYSTTSAVYCANMSCEFGDASATWNGCVSGNDYLVTVNDDSYVIENAESNAECTSLSVTIRHHGGTDTVTCNVTGHAENCSNISGVETVASCTID